MSVQNNLRELRLSKGLTQQRLAELAQISLTLVSRLENEERSPRFDIADRIAVALEVPLEVVFPKFALRKSPVMAREE